MVYERVTAEEDYVDVVPPKSLDLLDRGRYHVCVFSHSGAKIIKNNISTVAQFKKMFYTYTHISGIGKFLSKILKEILR